MAPAGKRGFCYVCGMRILFIANITPWPMHGGAHLRIFNLMERVAARHEVSIGCHAWNDADRRGVAELNRMGFPATAGTTWWGSTWRQIKPGVRYALRGIPPDAAQYQAPELHRLISEGNYDVLQIEESSLAPYAASMPRHRRIQTVITLHNVQFLQDRRIAEIESTRSRRMWRSLNARWMRHYEPRMSARFDRVITVSHDDRDALLRRSPGLRVDVIPNGVATRDLTPLPPHRGRPALVFVGTLAYRPCVDGAVWLVNEILPLLRRTQPELDVWIVGKQPSAEVLALAGPGVFVAGEVDDVRPYYARSSIAVVPLRAGGGSRLKILEAMALGRCVVSTTIGAEGLRVLPGTHVAIADDTASFATAIGALLANEPRRSAMEQAARRLVETEYDWDIIANAQLGIYDELADRASSPSP